MSRFHSFIFLCKSIIELECKYEELDIDQWLSFCNNYVRNPCESIINKDCGGSLLPSRSNSTRWFAPA